MALYRITKVRTETPPGYSHPHITDVELNDSAAMRFKRSTIINDLNKADGDRYYTEAAGERATVVVRACPTCGASDYITTLPDSTVKNNLLDLPRF